VVLTRDKDVFVPLHRRAQMARENRGKLFISLHANAHRNRKAKGFEVYFLSAAKTEDAEEVARRENKAIELEENLDYYASFLHLANLPKDIRDIQIDMESSVYLRESQDMCRIILDKAINATNLDNRGVKQAGFVVMSGTQAFMPSILVEIGFISNADEEKLLKRASYQKKLAESIYDAIITFKQRHERGLFSGG
jgi:N-acetylmuramoyl-L-alanine amidase